MQVIVTATKAFAITAGFLERIEHFMNIEFQHRNCFFFLLEMVQ